MPRTRKPRIYQGIEGVCRRCGATQPIPEVRKGGPGPLCQCGGQLADHPTWQRTPRLPATTIPYPKDRGHDREFVIQAYLLVKLREPPLKWDAHAEVCAIGQQDRFDIVVYQDRLPVRIIEVKPAEAAGVTKTTDEFVSWHWRERTEAEVSRYRAYGLPVDLVQGMEGAKEYLAWAQQRGTPQ